MDRITHEQIDEFVGLLRQNKVFYFRYIKIIVTRSNRYLFNFVKDVDIIHSHNKRISKYVYKYTVFGIFEDRLLK